MLHAQAWIEQGPGPILAGQTEGITNNPVSGGVNAIAIAPGDGNTVYAGTVNGGIWKSTNALSANPIWIPLTDQQLPALSIESLAISPLDANTIFGGTGSTSADAFDGNPGYGVVKSTNGGTTWTVLAGATFAFRGIASIVPTAATTGSGQVVLAATLFDGGGLYRSTDGGVTFARLSGNGVSGLPDGGVSNIVGDPGVPGRFYAGVPANFLFSGMPGVYKSEDSGASWVPVNTGLDVTNSDRILLSVHNSTGNDVVYAMVIVFTGTRDVLGGVYRSANQGGAWTLMDTPSPNIYPAGQGIIHGAIVAHPSNPAVLFIAGDRQDNPSGFPNANGCNNFTGNVFRGDASQSAGSQWAIAVCNGANGSSPHSDSRYMVFDNLGNVVYGSDGGLYKLTTPDAPKTRSWVSFQGTIRPTEFISTEYDPLSHINLGGSQDVGTPIQLVPGGQTWGEFLDGDGGVVAVDADQSAHAGTSLRYTSFDHLVSFNRSTWDAANNFLAFTLVGLNIVAGPGTGLNLFNYDPNIQFYNPYVLNNLDRTRMLIGTANIYESLDRGDSLTDFGFLGQLVSGLSYGSRLNGVPFPDAFYVGGFANPFSPNPRIIHRVTLGGPITLLTAYPGCSVQALVMDPQNYKNIYVLDCSNRVWGSSNEGATWVNLTANLASFSGDLRTIEIFSPDATPKNTVLLVGGQNGVFQMRRPGAAGASWTQLGTGLPRGLVLSLHYNYACDVLAAGFLGRGAWTVSGAFRGASTVGCPVSVMTTTSRKTLTTAPLPKAPPKVAPKTQPIH